MHKHRYGALCALLLGMILIPRAARAQLSDVLQEFITDHHGNTVNSPIFVQIPEGTAEPVQIPVPPLDIRFNEPSGAPSDHVHFDGYTVNVVSDQEDANGNPIPLARRTNARLIRRPPG